MALASDTRGVPGLLARTPSPGLILGGIASVQFGSAVATTLFSRIGPAGAVLLRLLTASVVLVVLWRPRVRAFSRRELLLAATFGLILAGMNLSFYVALHRIPLGIAVSIEFVGPLAVAIGGSRRPVDLLWVILAAGGILALTHGSAHDLSTAGILFALLAGCCWGAYILVNARVGQAIEGGSGLAVAMVVAALAVLPAGLIAGGTQLLAPHSLALGATVGILSSVIPYSFELEALRRISVSLFGVLMSIEPAMAAVAGLIVLGQGLSARELIGIGLVVVASAGASLHRRGVPVAV